MMSPSLSPAVAVIDVGSNSIKLLVAARGARGELVGLLQRTEETRIGSGISGRPPRLAAAAMDRALASIRALLADAARFSPARIQIVATSAVRDAANRDELISRVREAGGGELRVLTGDDEARWIGRGIACDPALSGATAFYLFDLGGGSLELLRFRHRAVEQLLSLPLGCVRLTELCVARPEHPIVREEIDSVREHVRTTVAASQFRFDLPAPAIAVATGGTATTFRAVQAAAAGADLAAASPVLRIDALETLGARLASLPLEARSRIPGVPAPRADVLPAALFTLVEVARLAGVVEFRHSMFNLRFGVAAELLGIG